MHLCIMAQRLEMSDTLHTVCDRLLIHNPSGAKGNKHIKTILNERLQDLKLYLSHNLDLYLLKLL